jgi:thiamine transport system substrate-binding protein
LAQKFLNFITTETFADIIPTTNWTYPVTKTTKGLPTGFDQLYVPSNMILMEGKTVQSNRKAWIHEWLKALAK